MWSRAGSASGGGFGAAANFAVGLSPTSVAIGDLNGDSEPDLATANLISNTVSVLLNASASSDALPPTTIASTSPAPNAAGWNNSAVTVTLAATDNAGGSGVKSITYTVGSGPATTVNGATTSFAVSAEGVTTITYYATDNAGNSEVPKSLALRIDTTAPMLNLPASVVADATSPAGAIVGYSVTATDNLDVSPTATCVPASGSTFPIGATTAACAARDAAGNSSIGSFAVTVNGPSAQGSNLIALVQSFNLAGGISNSLTVKLQNAIDSLAAGDTTSACNQLNAFINQALAQSGNNLTASQASQLIALANQLRAAAGCP